MNPAQPNTLNPFAQTLKMSQTDEKGLREKLKGLIKSAIFWG